MKNLDIKKILTDNIGAVLLYCFFFVGILGHLFQISRDFMLALTPYFLLIMGISVLIHTIKEKDWKVITWAVVVYIITLTLEIVGVHTGLIFGEYLYGPTLGLEFLGVPLVIGFNWTMVILGALKVTDLITDNRVIGAVLAGSFAVVFDYILEPVAMELDYWDWDIGTIPLQNYAAWFIIALVFASAFKGLKLKTENMLLVHYLIAQTIFFLILRLALT